jgi:hypothetical protein
MERLTYAGGCYDVYMCIPDRVTIMDSDGTGPCTRVYVVGCKWALTVIPYHHWVMSAPVPEATALAMLIWKMEAPEWDRWMLGSLPGRSKRGNGWVSSVVPPILFSTVM